MKILHLIYDHPDNPWLGGGGAVRARVINKELRKKGHEITIWHGAFKGAEQQTQSDVDYIPLGFSFSYLFSRISYSIFAMVRLVILRKRFDIIIDDISAFTWILPSMCSPRPVIGIVHHLIKEHAKKKVSLGAFFPQWWERYKVQNVQTLITVSQHVSDECKHLNPLSKTSVINAGVFHHPLEVKKEEGTSLVFIGRIDIYNKGLDILISCFENVYKKHPEISLIIAGSGKDETSLQHLIQNSPARSGIRWEGTVSEERKHELLSTSLLVCIPSRFEGWGMVAMEAAASKAVVAGHNIAGLREVVLHGTTGLLAELSIASYTEILLHLISSPKIREKLGKAAYQRSFEFSWPKVAKRHEQLYLETIRLNQKKTKLH